MQDCTRSAFVTAHVQASHCMGTSVLHLLVPSRQDMHLYE